ncbi:MAG: FAD-binding and (Fe-S)-binding domain-containing protein [Gemmatimonadales bacterium]|jgi:FAD/FMN-containing dehydrogenase/Fe-S oxidoreductase
MSVAERLIHELKRVVDGEVRFDAGTRAAYSRDASNYRQIPIGVVLPRHEEDVIEAVRLCHEAGAPILTRGGGTSLAGQCVNVAVVIDFSKHMSGVLEIDAGARRARVLPGTRLDELRAAAGKHGLTFGPDPATHAWCCLGGMIGNNSCGPHSVTAGKTVDNVEALEVLTSDGVRFGVGPTSADELRRIVAGGGRRGEIYGTLAAIRDEHSDLIRSRYPHIPRRVSGYNLDELLPEREFHVARALVGTEGTCVTYLEATLRLVPRPAERALVVLGYPDVCSAADQVPAVLEHGPLALEGIDGSVIDVLRHGRRESADRDLFPEGGGWLLVEFGGETRADVEERARGLAARLCRERTAPTVAVHVDRERQEAAWRLREAALGATVRPAGRAETRPGWEDSAVDPTRLGDYLRDLRRLLAEHGFDGLLYGHFGQGCVHCRISFDLQSAEGLAAYRSFVDEATDLVVSYGGSFSGEHGDGQSRGEWLPKMFGSELIDAFGRFKRAWDPAGLMNPGKLVNPRRMTDDLAAGPGRARSEPPTRFAFPDDEGRFSRAVARCAGVGKCRRLDGGTMCPSYMATRDETHTTRGRARILFEMLEADDGGVKGWRDDHVHEALDLCLACKGCKSDCPVGVDMATYKAEFLSHYYEGRLRPRSAYAMGLVHWWLRAASRAPAVVNFLGRAPGTAAAAKWLAGIAPERELPRIASRTFRRGFRPRAGPGRSRSAPGDTADGRVLLFPDTFNNFFHPETLRAGVDVLEAAGGHVEIPPRILCCGRPLYDYGMLDLARRQLRRILDTLRPWIRGGVPMVVLEPSCAATFRDELRGLFPDDPDAEGLRRQTFTLAEYLARWRPDWTPPKLEGRGVYWGHCHHRSIMGTEADRQLLAAMELELAPAGTGCCGMAGAFGFEREHYDLSIAVGERDLLPRARALGEDELMVADGFSCREQLRQTVGRRPLHLAELLSEALRAAPGARADA